MLPYPSGTLHLGHLLVYTIGDVLTHFRRRNGMHVLRPMGYDAFGLPAENAAIREGGHPREIVARNIEHIRWEFKRLGYAFDWTRELSTADPRYYRWTQWLFLKLLEAGLTYRKEAPVKWCPQDQVVLANEQVRDGHCEYCGAEVEARMMEQWFFKTTAYADELIDSLAELDWPERIVAMQRHWIGRSHGAEITFRIDELGIDIPVFTTRADTLFGATFFVIAPEHPLVEELAARSPHGSEMLDYARTAAAKRGEERAAAVEKTGVSTGFDVTNPVNGEQLPIWVADYVLMEYGTGAVMAVPAHDERDYAFARTFDLPVRTVVAPADGDVPEEGAFSEHTEGERLVNSDRFTGMSAPEGAARDRRVARVRRQGRSPRSATACATGASHVSATGAARSRSSTATRAGSCPSPRTNCPSCCRTSTTTGRAERRRSRRPRTGCASPCPRCGGEGRREVDTMDTFVDSSWYFLRYCDPHNDSAAFDRRIVDYWCPVDHYIGRRRPRRDAPDLRALLHEGVERHRPGRLPRAVREVLRQRLGAARRLEDVEVEGQRRSARTS